MATSGPNTQYAVVHVIAAVYDGPIGHSCSGLNAQDPGTSRFLWDENSSLESGNIDMASFR